MKEYLERKLSRVNRSFIGKLVRESHCLVSPPALNLDLYSLDQLHSYSKKRNLNCKAILDNNVVSGMLRIADQEGPLPGPFDPETLKVCGIMAYLIYTGIEIVPEFALYEDVRAGDSQGRRLNDYILRVIDHIAPGVLADLSSGKLTSIPVESYRQAKSAVDNNEATQTDLARHNYEDEDQPGVLLAYSKLMYAWLLYKKGASPERNLKAFLGWSFSKSLGSSSFDLFVAAFLSHNRLGKMIKNVNTDNSDTLLKNIKNVSWDLFYLASLQTMINESDVPTTWCFVTRDKLLTDIGPYLFQIQSESTLKEFSERFFETGAFPILRKYMEQVNSRPELGHHSALVEKEASMTINQLETDIKTLLNS